MLELSSDLSGNTAIGLLTRSMVTCRTLILKKKMLHMKEAVLVAVKQVMKKIMVQMKDNKTINQLKKNQIIIQITLKNNKAIIQVKKNQIMIQLKKNQIPVSTAADADKATKQ